MICCPAYCICGRYSEQSVVSGNVSVCPSKKHTMMLPPWFEEK